MSKERLEEIKEHFAYCMDEGLLFAEQEEKLLEELYEQAERAESLQEKLNAKIVLINKGDEEKRYVQQERMIELEQRNKRYRKALEEIKGATSHNKYWKYIAHKALESDEG